MFASVMILQLVEEGRIELTDTLDQFFPQVPNSKKITLAHILAHRGRIHDVLVDRSLRPKSTTGAPQKWDVLALLANSTPDFKPDTNHAYSNSGYFLLGRIIEQLTGKTYADALQERIVSKLDLKDTYIASGGIDVTKNESLTYFNTGGNRGAKLAWIFSSAWERWFRPTTT